MTKVKNLKKNLKTHLVNFKKGKCMIILLKKSQNVKWGEMGIGTGVLSTAKSEKE